MTAKYVYKTYGNALVYDSKLAVWREPITKDELWVQRCFDENLRRSFTDEYYDLPNKS
jgi:hypothetical protein